MHHPHRAPSIIGLLAKMPSREDLIDDLRSAAFAAGRAIFTTDCEAALDGANGDYIQALLALGLPTEAAKAEMERAEAARARERAARTRAATETVAALSSMAAGGVAAPPSSYTGTKPTSAYASVATSETVLPCPNSETPPPCPDTKPTAPLLNPKAATSDSAVWGPQLKTTGMTVRGQQLTTRPGVSLARLSSFWGSAKKKPDAGDEENADDWYATYCVGTCCDTCLGTCDSCCVVTCGALVAACNFILRLCCPPYCCCIGLILFLFTFFPFIVINHPNEAAAAAGGAAGALSDSVLRDRSFGGARYG